MFAKLTEGFKGGVEWIKGQLNMGADAAKKAADDANAKAKEEL